MPVIRISDLKDRAIHLRDYAASRNDAIYMGMAARMIDEIDAYQSQEQPPPVSACHDCGHASLQYHFTCPRCGAKHITNRFQLLRDNA